MLRKVKSVWVIVSIDLLWVLLMLPLLAGDNRIWGKKDRIMYCAEKVVCSFTQAQTDWQLPLAEQGSRLRLKRSHLRPKILICE